LNLPCGLPQLLNRLVNRKFELDGLLFGEGEFDYTFAGVDPLKDQLALAAYRDG
jgi:hypothetical protein